MRVAFSPDGEHFEAPNNVSTPSLYTEGLQLLIELSERCANGRKIDMICGGIAGPFTENRRTLLGSPNLNDWIGKPLKNDIEARLQAPIYIENDAALVALGEATFGAGKGSDIVAYITVSTGVGGARIVNGKIDQRTLGFEPGHQIIDFQNGKTLENLISGRALEEEMHKPAKEITDPDVWEKLAKILAVGINNVVVHWSPQVVVLGGSMIVGNPSIPLDSVEKHLREILRIFPELPMIKKGELGDLGGLWGALAFLKTNKV